jgi:formylglycine-generating enzyme
MQRSLALFVLMVGPGCNLILGNVAPGADGAADASGGVESSDGTEESGGADGSGGAAESGGSDSTGGTSPSGGADGSGGMVGTVGTVGTLGEPCAPNGALGCAGYAQKGQLLCDGGEWTANGTCSGNDNCDTIGSQAGSCQPILPDCMGADAGDPTAECAGNVPQVCGVDLTQLDDGSTCPGDQGCLDGACEPILPECLTKNENDTVCSEDRTVMFDCGPNRVVRQEVNPCDPGLACADDLTCVQASCASLPSTCGPDEDDSCCADELVTGGDFDRGPDATAPASISSFRLDTYEVTVGRFRRFVAAVVGGWLPTDGSGKHVHLSSGAGLKGTTTQNELGWDEAWNVGDSAHGLYTGSFAVDEWNSSLLCSTGDETWTTTPEDNETLPINCVTWYQAAAFCIYDGGFLPSEAEWEYAAGGGTLENQYPWGSEEPNCTYANYQLCALGATAVGSLSPKGNTDFGHTDMAGNMAEWTLDTLVEQYSASCDDCTNNSTGPGRASRGGAWGYPAGNLQAVTRVEAGPGGRYEDIGIRCARPP